MEIIYITDSLLTKRYTIEHAFKKRRFNLCV